MRKVSINKIIAKSGHLHLQVMQGGFSKLNLKSNDVIKITIEKYELK